MKLQDLSSKDLLEKLHAQINIHLDICDSEKTPRLCNFRSTPNGREKLLEDISTRVADRGISIQEALLEIEREFNPNFIDLD